MTRRTKLNILARYDDLFNQMTKAIRTVRMSDDNWIKMFHAFDGVTERLRLNSSSAEVRCRELELDVRKLQALQEHTERQLAMETESRKKSESEVRRLEHQIDLIRQVLWNEDRNRTNEGGLRLTDEARQQLSFLRSSNYGTSNLPPNRRDCSAGSFIDYNELSFDSVDDCESPQNNSNTRNTARYPLRNRNSEQQSDIKRTVAFDDSTRNSVKKNRNSNNTLMEDSTAYTAVTTTTRVDMSGINADMQNVFVQPSAPPQISPQPSQATICSSDNNGPDQSYRAEYVPGNNQRGRKRKSSSETADSYWDVEMAKRKPLYREQSERKPYWEQVNTNKPVSPQLNSSVSSTVSKDIKLQPNGLFRNHQFFNKTQNKLRREQCYVCSQSLPFGRKVLKCNRCRVVVHVPCSEDTGKMPICMPSNVTWNGSDSVTEMEDSLATNLRQCKETPGKLRTVGNSPFKKRDKSPASSKMLSDRYGGHGNRSLARANSQKSKNAMTTVMLHDGPGLQLNTLCPENYYPRIPAMVVHLIQAIESRDLSEQMIYRSDTAERSYIGLFDKFLHGRTLPNLSSVRDVSILTSCLKAFFRCLDEPLVTYDCWRPLADAADLLQAECGADEQGDVEADARDRAMDIIKRLPIVNRQTLSYLVQHLQKLNDLVPGGRATPEVLVKLMAPSVVGNSCPDPEVTQAMSETTVQQSIMYLLLTLPGEFYRGNLEIKDCESSEDVNTVDSEEGVILQPGSFVDSPFNYGQILSNTSCGRDSPNRSSKQMGPFFPSRK